MPEPPLPQAATTVTPWNTKAVGDGANDSQSYSTVNVAPACTCWEAGPTCACARPPMPIIDAAAAATAIAKVNFLIARPVLLVSKAGTYYRQFSGRCVCVPASPAIGDEWFAAGAGEEGVDGGAIPLAHCGVVLAEPAEALALVRERALAILLAVDLADHLLGA